MNSRGLGYLSLLLLGLVLKNCAEVTYPGQVAEFRGGCSILEDALRYTPREGAIEEALENLAIPSGKCRLLIARSNGLDAILLHNPRGDLFLIKLYRPEGLEKLQVTRTAGFFSSGYTVEKYYRTFASQEEESLGINGVIFSRVSGCAGTFPEGDPKLYTELNRHHCEPSPEIKWWLTFAMDRVVE